MKIRAEAAQDVDDIGLVTQAAFANAEHASGTEALIVSALRESGALSLSLVAESDGKIIGHAGFSPVLIEKVDCGWLGLGPVSVLPTWQGKGTGSAMIREGLRRMAALGAKGCVVLGDPGYYRRFGFEQDSALHFIGAPPEYFMRLRIADPMPAGKVTYHPAFYQH